RGAVSRPPLAGRQQIGSAGCPDARERRAHRSSPAPAAARRQRAGARDSGASAGAPASDPAAEPASQPAAQPAPGVLSRDRAPAVGRFARCPGGPERRAGAADGAAVVAEQAGGGADSARPATPSQPKSRGNSDRVAVPSTGVAAAGS